jgi:hypothetical protein
MACNALSRHNDRSPTVLQGELDEYTRRLEILASQHNLAELDGNRDLRRGGEIGSCCPAGTAACSSVGLFWPSRLPHTRKAKRESRSTMALTGYATTCLAKPSARSPTQESAHLARIRPHLSDAPTRNGVTSTFVGVDDMMRVVPVIHDAAEL